MTKRKRFDAIARTSAIAVFEDELKTRSDGYVEHLVHGGKADCGEEFYLDALYMAIAALREQPQWISVKDALPVINDNEPLEEFVTDRGYTFIVSDGKYVWTELFLLKANKFDDESVTHWMPLPEMPPKEDT